METGKLGGQATEYQGPSSPFLAWEIGRVRVAGSKVFPVTSTTGLRGNEKCAAFNLTHGNYAGTVAYVGRNIARAVVVDNSRSGVEYSLDVEVKAWGLEEGLEMNLSQKSPRHGRLNLRAAVRTFAETIVTSLSSGFYLSLREAGCKFAGETETPGDLVETEADTAF